MRRFARVRTKNPTAEPLRGSISTDKRAVVRLGSLTPTEKIFPGKVGIVEVNKVEAIENSRSKLLMKACFAKFKVPQAEWFTWGDIGVKVPTRDKLPYPIVVKRIFGFKGHGMELMNNEQEFHKWLTTHNPDNGWYFERFYNYSREYRLHVAKEIGVFMSWRKLRKDDAKERWFFNSTNCNWVGVEHELFDRPTSWKRIEEASINALNATGLDIGAVDVRVQSNKHKDPQFIVCEINSAPALGDQGVEKYKEIINLLINK